MRVVFPIPDSQLPTPHFQVRGQEAEGVKAFFLILNGDSTMTPCLEKRSMVYFTERFIRLLLNSDKTHTYAMPYARSQDFKDEEVFKLMGSCKLE